MEKGKFKKLPKNIIKGFIKQMMSTSKRSLAIKVDIKSSLKMVVRFYGKLMVIFILENMIKCFSSMEKGIIINRASTNIMESLKMITNTGKA